MSKRLSQLNQIEQATPENYMLLDAENFLESKKIKLKDIDIENFNTTKFYNREQADEKIISAIAECVEKVEGNSMTDQVYAVDSIGTPKPLRLKMLICTNLVIVILDMLFHEESSMETL